MLSYTAIEKLRVQWEDTLRPEIEGLLVDMFTLFVDVWKATGNRAAAVRAIIEQQNVHNWYIKVYTQVGLTFATVQHNDATGQRNFSNRAFLDGILDYYNNGAAARATAVNSTTVVQIGSLLDSLNLQAGAEFTDVSWYEKAGKTWSQVQVVRANTITEMEVVSASGIGMKTGAEAADLEGMKKRWRSNLDAAVRPAHAAANGLEAETDEQFLVWGELLDFPQDMTHGATLKNIMNCRCAAQWGTEDEFAADPQRPPENVVVPPNKPTSTTTEGEGKPKEKDDKPAPVPKAVRKPVMERKRVGSKTWQEIEDELDATVEKYINSGDEIDRIVGEINENVARYNEALAKYDKDEARLILKEIQALEAEMHDLSQFARKIKEETHAIIELPEAERSGINVLSSTYTGSDRRKRYLNEAVTWLRSMVARDALPGELKVNAKKNRSNRAFYRNRDLSINMAKNDLKRTFVHELAHGYEYLSNEIHEDIKAFYDRRTNGEALKWLGRGYSKHEVTRADDFFHPYVGKDYYQYGRPASEVVSMGFERIFHDPLNFYMDDKDHFMYLLRVFQSPQFEVQ